MRPEKGSNLTVESIFEILSNNNLLEFTLKLRKPKGEEYSELKTILESIAEERIEWLEGNVDNQIFCDFIEGNIVNIITYSNKAFRMRPSGVFADSIIANVPVLVPTGTDMALLVNEYNNGEVYQDGDVLDLVKKVVILVQNSEKYRYGCNRIRDTWQKEHSWDRLLQAL